MFHFDSTNWDSIKEAICCVKKVGEMIAGINESDEIITFQVDGPDTLITTTYQHNGWIRKNYYHTDDYSVEELYEKEKV